MEKLVSSAVWTVFLEIIEIVILVFLDFCSYRQCPFLQSFWFFFYTVSAGVLERQCQYLFGLKEGKPFCHFSVCPRHFEPCFSKWGVLFILTLYPWAHVSVECWCNTRSLWFCFLFLCGNHSTFAGFRITHFLSVLEHLTPCHRSHNWWPGALSPLPGMLISRTDVPSILD